MVADGKGVVTVFGDPGGGGEADVQEEECAAGNVGSLEADLCRQRCAVARGIVNRAVKNGAELDAVLTVENYAVDRIRIVP